jgi:hypothetical protein
LFQRQADKCIRIHCDRRIGSNRFDIRKDRRICDLHPTEEQEANIEWINVNGKTKNTLITMCLPCSAVETKQQQDADYDNTARMNKGVGFDRFIANQIEKVKQISLEENGTTDSTFLVLSQVIEEMEGRTGEINDVVAENVGIVKPTTCNNSIRYYVKEKKK